jgi:tRNA (cmo5U34)-methyltransferase
MSSEIGWSEHDSEQFARYARYFIPDRLQQIETICSTLPHIEGELRVLELGCGDGELAQAITTRFGNATVHGLDGSAFMLERARQRLHTAIGRFVPESFELDAPDWRARAHPVHAVVSSLVVHHLDGPGKQRLFHDLYALLQPDGVIAIADVVRPASEIARRFAAAAWDRSVREQIDREHGPEEAINVFRSQHWNMFEYLDEDPIDRPSLLTDQLDWLRAAGFTEVDVYWMKAGHAVFGGRKLGDPRSAR